MLKKSLKYIGAFISGFFLSGLIFYNVLVDFKQERDESSLYEVLGLLEMLDSDTMMSREDFVTSLGYGLDILKVDLQSPFATCTKDTKALLNKAKKYMSKVPICS